MNWHFDYYERDNSSSERLVLALLIALLLHLLFLMVLLLVKHHDQTGVISSPLTESIAQEFELPTQRAGGSAFGKGEPHAKVIYYDTPIPIPEPPAPPIEQVQEQKKTPATQPPSLTKPQVPPEVSQKIFYEPIPSSLAEEEARIAAPIIHDVSPEQSPTDQQSEQKISAPQREQEPVNPFLPRLRRGGRTAATLQKIADGFLEAMAQENGSDTLNMHGTHEARMEDIATIDYIQKISWQLQQAFKSDTTVVSIGRDEHAETLVKIVIDAQGEIVDLELQDPPHNPSFDRLLRTIIYHAAPFPPIPKHLNRQIFVHRISVRIDLPAGTHRPHWICY